MVKELNGPGVDSPELIKSRLDTIDTNIRELQETIQENTRSLTTIGNLLTNSRDSSISFIPNLMTAGLKPDTGDSNDYLSTSLESNSNTNNLFPNLTTSLSNTVASLWSIFLPKREIAKIEESNSHQADSENPSDESKERVTSTTLKLPTIQETLDSFNTWEKDLWANEDIQSQTRRDTEKIDEQHKQDELIQSRRDEERIAEEHRQDELIQSRRDEEKRAEEHRQEELMQARRDEERRSHSA